MNNIRFRRTVLHSLCICVLLLYGCSGSSKSNTASSDSSSTASTADSSTVYSVLPNLSKDIRSFEVQIKDTVLKFPMTYNDFHELGWEIKSNQGVSLDDEIQSSTDKLVWFTNGDLALDFDVYNPDISVQPISSSVICGLTASYNEVKDSDFVFIPGGFQFGVASKDDIISALGEPDYSDQTDDTHYFAEYKTDNVYAYVKLGFIKGILQIYEFEDPAKPEGYSLSKATDSTGQNYTAPTALSNDVHDGIVNFDGDLYQLPVPVSAMIEKGWTLSGSEDAVSGGGIAFITLQRNGIQFDATVYNSSNTACQVKDASIRKMSSQDVYKKEFEVSGGFNMDMTMESCEAAFDKQGLKYTKETSSNSIHYYYYLDEKVQDKYISIYFDSSTKAVQSITLAYY